MTVRICWHGHRVTDDDATDCPFCGVSLDNAKLLAAAESERYDQGLPGAGRSWNWIGTGVLVSVLGLVVELVSDEDAGTVVASVLFAFGALAFLIGAVGVGVFNGMLDHDARKRAESVRDRPRDEP